MSGRIPLGSYVRDTFTGFAGHATGRVEHLHGVPELKVTTLRDGAIYHEWIDEARCVEVNAPDARVGFAAHSPSSGDAGAGNQERA